MFFFSVYTLNYEKRFYWELAQMEIHSGPGKSPLKVLEFS